MIKKMYEGKQQTPPIDPKKEHLSLLNFLYHMGGLMISSYKGK